VCFSFPGHPSYGRPRTSFSRSLGSWMVPNWLTAATRTNAWADQAWTLGSSHGVPPFSSCFCWTIPRSRNHCRSRPLMRLRLFWEIDALSVQIMAFFIKLFQKVPPILCYLYTRAHGECFRTSLNNCWEPLIEKKQDQNIKCNAIIAASDI
jgi:hypothetical protein